jgi:hypothetical protein
MFIGYCMSQINFNRNIIRSIIFKNQWNTLKLKRPSFNKKIMEISTNNFIFYFFSSFFRRIYRGAGVERTLEQHLTKKNERDLGNFLMASTWPHNHHHHNKYKHPTANGYHWMSNTHNKKYQNYLALNFPMQMECKYIVGKWRKSF